MKKSNSSMRMKFHRNVPPLPKLQNRTVSSPLFKLKQKSNLPQLDKKQTAGGNQIINNDGEKLSSFIIKYTVIRDLSRRDDLKLSQSLNKVPQSEVAALFSTKCRACFSFCDFSKMRYDEHSKLVKAELLKEICDAIKSPNIVKFLLTEQINLLVRMISINLFRTFPNVQMNPPPEFVMDNEYGHIDFVYQVLDELLKTKNVPKINISPSINNVFVNGLFQLFYAYDVREQKWVKTILSSIAQNFQYLRLYIFKKITHFLRLFDEDFKAEYVIPYILELLCDIYPLVSNTIKNNEQILKAYLLPLYIKQNYPTFHNTLLQVVNLIIQKDPTLSKYVIKYLLKHWPVKSPQKISIFFNTISSIYEHHGNQIELEINNTLFLLISSFFQDPSGDVSQQSLFLLSTNFMLDLISLTTPKIANIIYRRAMKTYLSHWIPDTRHFALDLANQLQSCNFMLDKAATTALEEEMYNEEKKRNECWARITGKMPEYPTPLPVSYISRARSRSLGVFHV